MTPTKRWNGADWIEVVPIQAQNGVPDPDWTDIPPEGFRVMGIAPAEIRTLIAEQDPGAQVGMHSDHCIHVVRTTTGG